MEIREILDEIKVIERHANLENVITENISENNGFFDNALKKITDKKVIEYEYRDEPIIPLDIHERYEQLNQYIKQHPILDKLDEITVMEKVENIENMRFKISFENEVFLSFYLKNFGRKEEYGEEDLRKIYSNVLLNCCSLIEKIFGNLFKDYLLNKNNKVEAAKIIKDKQLSYDDLLKIESIDKAKEYLIDKTLIDFFRPKFKDWLYEFSKKLKLGLTNNNDLRETIDEVQEMFYIRNLYTHAGGVVNDEFTMKTKKYNDLKNGELFKLDKNIVGDFITHTANLLILSVYFINKKILIEKDDKTNIQTYYGDLNNVLSKALENKWFSIQCLYDDFEKIECLNVRTKLYAKVNSYIYDYYHLEEDVTKKIEENFDVDSYENVFKLAKAILCENQYLTLELLNKELEEESKVFEIYDWPLIKIASQQNKEIETLLKSKINDILNIEKEW